MEVGRKISKGIEWFSFCKNGGARVSGAFGAVPDLEIFGVINFSLAGFSFGFLKTEDVRLVVVNKFRKGIF